MALLAPLVFRTQRHGIAFHQTAPVCSRALLLAMFGGNDVQTSADLGPCGLGQQFFKSVALYLEDPFADQSARNRVQLCLRVAIMLASIAASLSNVHVPAVLGDVRAWCLFVAHLPWLPAQVSPDRCRLPIRVGAIVVVLAITHCPQVLLVGCHVRPFRHESRGRVFQGPPPRLEVFKYFQRPFGQCITNFQVARPSRERSTEFGARRTQMNVIKPPRRILSKIPFKHVDTNGRFKFRQEVHGDDFPVFWQLLANRFGPTKHFETPGHLFMSHDLSQDARAPSTPEPWPRPRFHPRICRFLYCNSDTKTLENLPFCGRGPDGAGPRDRSTRTVSLGVVEGAAFRDPDVFCT